MGSPHHGYPRMALSLGLYDDSLPDSCLSSCMMFVATSIFGASIARSHIHFGYSTLMNRWARFGETLAFSRSAVHYLSQCGRDGYETTSVTSVAPNWLHVCLPSCWLKSTPNRSVIPLTHELFFRESTGVLRQLSASTQNLCIIVLSNHTQWSDTLAVALQWQSPVWCFMLDSLSEWGSAATSRWNELSSNHPREWHQCRGMSLQ